MRMMATAIFIGFIATICIDLWAIVLRYTQGIRSLDYCMLGRWILHMTQGTFTHRSIGASAPRRHECKLGWFTHYSIGAGFALVFLVVAPVGWLDAPTVVPALTFGMATVVVPFFTLQPAIGLGIASSKTPAPWRARLKSVLTHAVFGLGLYIGGMAVAAGRTMD